MEETRPQSNDCVLPFVTAYGEKVNVVTNLEKYEQATKLQQPTKDEPKTRTIGLFDDVETMKKAQSIGLEAYVVVYNKLVAK